MAIVQPSVTLNSSTTVPTVGFGTYLISSDDAPAAVSRAIDAGYRHIDTASGYQNEEGVGIGIDDALSSGSVSRDDLFVTTKLWPGNPAWGDEPKTAAQTKAECNESLRRLRLDYVDLYLIHTPSGDDRRVEQWSALLDLQREGKTRSVGVSNFNQTHLEEIRLAGLPLPDANQIELHPWSQKPALVAYMHEHGIAAIAYSSLVPLSTWRTDPGQESAKTEQMKLNAGVFTELAKKYQVTEAQLLLRWGVQNGYAVLPKSLNAERMRNNLDLFSFEIDDADMTGMRGMDQGDGVAWATGDPSK